RLFSPRSPPPHSSPPSLHDALPIFDQQIPIAGIAHNCGTARFGNDPRTSVLDVDCKAHDLDNLYVVDTSFFPSSAAVNPALTARSEEHTSELQSLTNLVCRLLLDKH